MLPCPECGELRSTLALKSGRSCWRCAHQKFFEPNEAYEVPAACIEGIPCLRVVEINEPDQFGMMFVHDSLSNTEAMVAASFTSWGMINYVVRPLWTLETIR
jgi:hypothetical protein